MLEPLKPHLLLEWHPTKNSNLNLESISAGSHVKAWWVCAKGHEWEAVVASRVKHGCPYCSGRKPLKGENDLPTTHPEIAIQWHPIKNNSLMPENYFSGSEKRIWWECDRGHEWEETISNVTRRNIACPYCSGRHLKAGFNDLATLNPKLATEWNFTLNNELFPNMVMINYSKKVWWECDKGHEWEALIYGRHNKNIGCPYCANQKILVGYNDLATIYPLVAVQWHPTKNLGKEPFQVSGGSSKKAWWSCSKGHEWEATIYSRTNKNTKCPYCIGQKAISGENDISSSHPELVKLWHRAKNNLKRPTDFSYGSNHKVWWACSEGHEWETTVKEQSIAGDKCPYCSNKKVLDGFNDLATVEPELLKQWNFSRNGNLSPSTITRGSGQKVWWACEKNHEWEAYPYSRTGRKNSSCPVCAAGKTVSKAEIEIFTYLSGIGVLLEQSNRIILKDNKELDIFVPEKKIAIEYNGLYWHSEEQGKGRTYHYDKWLECKEQGIQLIQIWEDDWNRNPEQIKKMLTHKIGLSKELKFFARNTEIQVLNLTQAKIFLEDNHIQGFANGSYYLGLTEKGTPEKLLAVLVLKNEAGTNGKVLNIIRYATAANMVGGFTKLLSYAAKTYVPDSFITFSDNCVSDGGLYKNNGFIVDKELKPDYMYVIKGERKHKFSYRIKRFINDPELLWEESLTESQLAKLNNLPRIWDAGKTRWVKIV